jgi:hypothetical protein
MAERHVLVVAHRTAATAKLADCVRERAASGPARFTLLVPRPYWDPDTDEAQLVLELALPVLEEAAGGRIETIIGETDPLEAVRHALTSAGDIDEVIVSTLPRRVSHWLHLDLPSRVQALGVPVTVVTASERAH